MTPFAIRRTIVIGYFLALGIICFITLYTYLNFEKTERENRKIANSLETLRVIDQIYDDVQVIESSQRGYIITGNRVFLEPYYATLKRIDGDFKKLSSLTSSADLQRKNDIDTMLSLTRQKLDFTASTIQLRSEIGENAARESIETLEGRSLMNKIFTHIQKMENEDRIILSKYQEHRAEAARKTSILFLILACLFISFLLFFFFITRQEIRNRLNKELANQVVQKTDAFRNILDRIRDGVVALDKDWNYVYINSATASLFNMDPEKIKGKNIWDVYPELKNQTFGLVYREAMETQEYRLYHGFLESQNRWYENKIYPSPEGLTIHIRDITESKKTESSLEQVTERFNIVIKATNDILWEADLENKTLWWNDNFYQKFGYDKTKSPLKDTSWENYLHPDDKERVLAKVNECLADPAQSTWVSEYRLLKSDGDFLHIYDRCHIIRNSAGKATRMIGSMADLTSLFQARKELQYSEELYKSLVNSIDGIVWEADPETFQFSFVSRQTEKILGYTPEEWLVPDFWLSHVHEEDREWVVKFCVDRTREKKSHEFEYRMIARDGGIIWLRDIVSVIGNEEKNIKLRGLMIDITSAKAAEIKIKQANERFNAIARATSDIIWDWDLVDDTMWWNDTYYSKLGFKRKTILHSNSWTDCIHEEDKERVLESLKFSMNNKGRFWSGNYRFLKADGEVLDVFDRGYIFYDDDLNPRRMVGSMIDVTTANRAQEAIRQSEEKYRTLVEQATDGIFIAEPGGKFIMVNSSGSRMSQYSEEELRHMTIFDLADPEDLKHNPFRFEEMINAGSARSERKMRKKDGTVIDIEVNAKFLSDMRFLAFIRDITDQKKAAIELQTSEETRRLIMDSSLDAIICIDLDGIITVWSRQAEKIFGWSKEEVIGKRIEDTIIPPRYRDQHLAGMQRYFQTGVGPILNNLVEFSAINKNQEEFFVELSIVAINQGSSKYFCSYIRDITSRKKIEEEILRARNLADKLIDSLPGVFYLYDEEGKFIRWNKQFEIVTGYSSKEMKETNTVEFFDESVRGKVKKCMKEGFEKGETVLEESLKTKSGELIPYYFKSVMVNYEGKPCLLGSGIDISERKKAEEAIKVSEERYRLLFYNNPLPMWMLSLPGLQFIDVNEAAISHYGYSRREFMSMGAPDLRPAEDLTEFFESEDKKFEGITNTGTWQHRKKDGTLINVDIITHDVLYNGKTARLILANDVTQKLKAEGALKDSLESIRQLTDHIQNIREEERSHIAREIHDELGQQLTVLKMDVSWLNKQIGGSDEQIRHKLKSLTQLLDGTVNTVRRISSELRPSILDDLGLVATMDWHLSEFERRSGIKTYFKEPEEEPGISLANKTGLFRIFQESLTNVARHSNAQKVIVNLQQIGEQIILSIEDDGDGFEKLKAKSKKTLGILGMEERTARMGGNYEISSKPGKGTIVVVSVPIEKDFNN